MYMDHDHGVNSAPPTGDVPGASHILRPPGREVRRWKLRWGLYIILIFMIGMATSGPSPQVPAGLTGPVAESFEKGYAVGTILGGGLGALLFCFAVAALIMGWRENTRSLIPGTACFVALLSLVGNITRSAETDVQHTTLAAENDQPPAGTAARRAWATRLAGEDMAAYRLARAASHGVGQPTLPEGWLSMAYVADAGKYPHVQEHFTRYREWQQEMDTTEVSVFINAVRTRLQQSGLRPYKVDEIMLDVRKEMDDAAPEIRRRLDSELALVSAALALHAYLESVDERVHLDEAGEVRFSRDAERTRASQMADEVMRSAAVVNSLASSSGRGPTGGTP